MKKTKYVSHAIACILAAAALFLWCAGVFTARRAGDSLHAVSARWASGGVSPAQLEARLDIFREDGSQGLPVLTLWAQHASQSISIDEDTSAKMAVLELYGPAENLRADRYLSGGPPAKGSAKTCSLSEGAAFALWGGTNAVGQSLVWNGQDYAVQGVFAGEDALVVVQALPESKTEFADMQIYIENGGRQAVEEFLATTNFGSPQLLDMPVLGWALELLAFLPALLIGLWLLARLLLHGLRLRGKPKELLYYIPAALAAAIIDLFLLSRMRPVPAALIPSRWSDFDYWETLAQNLSDCVETWLSMPRAGDIELLFSLLGAALAVFASLLIITVLLSKVHVRKPLHALIACGGSVLVMLLMALNYADQGGLRIDLTMWLMPCLWILTDCALAWLKGGERLEKPDEAPQP